MYNGHCAYCGTEIAYKDMQVGEYTIIVTDDDDGAKVLNEAWDDYVEESEEK